MLSYDRSVIPNLSANNRSHDKNILSYEIAMFYKEYSSMIYYDVIQQFQHFIR